MEHFLPLKHREVLHAYFGKTVDEPLTVTEREIIARAFDVYDMSGRAPNDALRDTFGYASDWLAKAVAQSGKAYNWLLGEREKRQGKLPPGSKPSQLIDLIYREFDKAKAVEGAQKEIGITDLEESVQARQGLKNEDVVSTADPERIVERKLQEGDAVEPEAAPEGAPTSVEDVYKRAAEVRAERANAPVPDEELKEAAEALAKQEHRTVENDAQWEEYLAKRAEERKAERAAKAPDGTARVTVDIELPSAQKGPFAKDVADREARRELSIPQGEVVEVNLKDGRKFVGRLRDDTGTRVVIGRSRIRWSDVMDIKDIVRPDIAEASARLDEAARRGDEAAVDKAEQDLIRLRADGAEGALADADVLFQAGNQSAQPVQFTPDDFEFLEREGIVRGRRPSTMHTPETVETDSGLFEVQRTGRVVNLIPATGQAIPVGAAPPMVNGTPSSRGDSTIVRLMGRVNKAGDAVGQIPGRLAELLAVDVPLRTLFSDKHPVGRWLRSRFTEMDQDPEIADIRNRSLGRRQAFIENVMADVLRKAEQSGVYTDSAKSETLGRALFEGTDFPDDPQLVQAVRKAFNHLGQRMVEEGLITQETFEAHKDKFMPLMNWSAIDPKALRKEIRRLEKKRASGTTLTNVEVRSLQDLKRKLSELSAAVPTPHGLFKKVGEVPENLIDARDVLSALGRTRARRTQTWEEAKNKGLNTQNVVRDVLDAMAQEVSAVERLAMFREIREYGLNHPDRLVLPPETGPGLKQKPGYVLLHGSDATYKGTSVFGSLEGHYVKDSLWSALEVYAHHPSEWGKTWDRVHGFFKVGKTAWRWGGHLVQRIGNPMIWLSHGVPAFRFREIIRNGRGVVNGGIAPSGETVEYNGKQIVPTREWMQREGILVPDDAGRLNLTDKAAQQESLRGAGIDTMTEGWIEAVRNLPGLKTMEKWYALPDQYSRAGLYMYFRKHEGLTHRDAVRKVRQWYDVNNVPAGIRATGRVWSFFRFQYLMMRNMRSIVRHTPWAFAKVAAVMAGVHQVHRAAMGMSQEEYDRALYAAFPGDDFGSWVKRVTAVPWPVGEIGGGHRGAGWFSIWNMFPQQTMLQYIPGMTSSPAEEKTGSMTRRVANAVIGSQSVILKPVVELASDTDAWSQQRNLLRNRYGADPESPLSTGVAALKHLGSQYAPAILSEGYRAIDATGLVPGPLSLRRPDASGNFPSPTDELARFGGIPVRRPDEVRADITRSRQTLEKDPSAYLDNDDRWVVSRDADKADRRRVNKEVEGFQATLITAASRRTQAWLEEGKVAEAVREIRSRERWLKIRREATERGSELLDQYAEQIVPLLK